MFVLLNVISLCLAFSGPKLLILNLDSAIITFIQHLYATVRYCVLVTSEHSQYSNDRAVSSI